MTKLSINDLLTKIKSGEISCDTFEAIAAPQNKIDAPNFHYVSFRDPESNVMIGICIDFDLWVYSKDQDNEKANRKIFNRMIDAVLLHIATLIKVDDLDSLYADARWDFAEQSFAKIYFDNMAKNRIKSLKKSLLVFSANLESSDDLSDDELEIAIKKLQDTEDKIKSLKDEIATILTNRKRSNIVDFSQERLKRVS